MQTDLRRTQTARVDADFEHMEMNSALTLSASTRVNAAKIEHCSTRVDINPPPPLKWLMQLHGIINIHEFTSVDVRSLDSDVHRKRSFVRG
jgi:hypothetical protein